MAFTFEEQTIKGVFVITPQVFGDNRGYFCEVFKAPDFAAYGIPTEFVQDNESSSLVASYIPYRRVIYNLEEKSVNADRIQRFNERHGIHRSRKKTAKENPPEQLTVFDAIGSMIILSGQWLKDAGFNPGDKAAVTVKRNRITIRKIKEENNHKEGQD